MMTFKELQESTKNELINMFYNDFITSVLHDDDDNKLIPYIGWYWRQTDFAGRNITIGDACDYIGVMENNKWDYPERKLTGEEVDIFIGLIDRAITGNENISLNKLLGELRDWMQSLII